MPQRPVVGASVLAVMLASGVGTVASTPRFQADAVSWNLDVPEGTPVRLHPAVRSDRLHGRSEPPR